MDNNVDPSVVEDARQRHQVILVRMHPARRQQSHDMAPAGTGVGPVDEAGQHRIVRQIAGGDGGVDSRQVLGDNAAAATAAATSG